MEQLTNAQLAIILEGSGKVLAAIEAIQEMLATPYRSGQPAFSKEMMELVEVKVSEIEHVLKKLSASRSLPAGVGGMFRSATTDSLAEMLALVRMEVLVRQLQQRGYEPQDYGLPTDAERRGLVWRNAACVLEAIKMLYSFPIEQKVDEQQQFGIVKLTSEVIREMRVLRPVWMEGFAGAKLKWRIVVDDPQAKFIAQEVPVWGHPQALRMVIQELVANAFKFSETRSKNLRVMRGRFPLSVQIRQCKEEVVVGVTNFGAEISEEDAPRVWEGSFRTKSAAGVRGGGWGLPMVQELIVGLHQGRAGLTRETSPSGVTVWFSIPDQTNI